MQRPARKLRISGKGRGNLTNTAPLPEFIAHFNGQFLRNAFSRFFNADLIEFLEELGVATTSERGGRVFPASDRAQDLVDALVRWVGAQGADLWTETRVRQLVLEDNRVAGVEALQQAEGRQARRQSFRGGAVVLATGGASYPATGSTGDGYRFAQAVGHTVIPIRPALVPIETAGTVASRLQGLSLRNVRLSVRADGREQATAFGEMLFTHFGVSGPIVLSQSRRIVDMLREGRQVTLAIDLKPALDEDKLDARLLRDLNAHGKRQFQTLLKDLLPRMLIPVCIEQTGIPQHKVGHQVTAAERRRLLKWLKDFCLDVTGYRGFEEAIVTAGGVDVREVDPRTMASRLVDGLYLVGEVLDIDADTGGYNLQAAFSTGWVAGRAAAERALGEAV
jgi:predicted Rossmann fold flavoprotein